MQLEPQIVGRDAELASLRAFIDEAKGGTSALVLEGEAGIGKSTLWDLGVEHARAHGTSVLSSRPVEAERGLAHLGIGDLLEDVLDDVLPELSRPRRRALEVALLREEPSGDPIDPRALGVAVRDALQLLTQRGPVLIAVDDIQWFDQSSSNLVEFALRRLAASPIQILVARRLAEGGE
jgi:predicted ATPase